ncbi:MAG TPA: PrsW family intramembrane metalloprotease [Burkholderiales bacterium]|nr:PrsW family intramembrane metalloprotease [Burkholderiales bacterium]
MARLSHRDYDPLLLGSPLRRRGPCLVLSAALACLLGIAALVQLGLFAGMRADVSAVFFGALLVSSLLALVPLRILWYLDRRERETPWLFAAAFFWGGLIATGLALPFNSAFAVAVDAWVMQHPMVKELLGPDAAQLISAPISAPIVEELTKAIGVLALFWLLRAEFDNMRDGIVYGALVGLGFNWFEAPIYVAQGYAETGLAPWGMQLGWRYALFGLGGHALFTALFGASLGLALQTRRHWLRMLAPIGGLGLAIAAHAVNNALPLFFALAAAAAGEPPPQEDPTAPGLGFFQAFLSGSLVELTIFLPFVAILAVALWRSGVWERRVIREELAHEVGRTVSEDEYREIERDRMLRTRRIDPVRRRASAALVNAQHELAFRKRRVRDRGEDPELDRLVARWRGEIRRLGGR